MARKKPTPEVELLPPESPPANAKTKTVQAKHTVVYESPVVVPDEAPEEIDGQESDEFGFEPIQTARAKRKPKTMKDDVLEAMEAEGIGGSEGLTLNIDFHPDYYENGLYGVNAKRKFRGSLPCLPEFIASEQYLAYAQRFGPGAYWFTLRYTEPKKTGFKTKIIKSWLKEIDALPAQTSQIQNGQQFVSMPDPANPNVTIQMPAGQPQPIIDPLKQMRESLKMMKEMREAMGMIEPQQQQPVQPQLSPELQMASFMLQDADLKKKAIKSLFGANGDAGEKDFAELIITNVEPIGKMLEGLLDKVADRFFGGKQNGTAPMVQASHANNAANQGWPAQGQADQSEAVQISGQLPHGGDNQISNQDAAIAPEDALLAFVMDQCRRKVPPKIVARRIIEQADAINQAAPIQSIDGFLELFISLTIDEALAFVASYSDAGKEIAGLEHAKTWTEQLQAELKPAFENGGQV